ncbi:MAG: hypothetical protein RLZZ393_1186 [Pseudomonadota bacterium]
MTWNPSVDRRRFMTGSVALAAGATLATKPSWGRPAPDLMICDTRCATQLRGQDGGAPIAWFTGDITPLWNRELRRLWQSGEATIAGISHAPALFCLEQLARRARHRIVWRNTIPGTDAVHWIIAPVATRGWI